MGEKEGRSKTEAVGEGGSWWERAKILEQSSESLGARSGAKGHLVGKKGGRGRGQRVLGAGDAGEGRDQG